MTDAASPRRASTHAREEWSTSRGFVLAALGSAVGLGNVWRFSYIAGENGGGAFLLVYFAAVLLVGVPLLLAEFGLGRSTASEGVAAFRTLAPGSAWRHAGALGVVVAGLILAYYAVITGWVLKYVSVYLLPDRQPLARTGHAAAFQAFIASGLEPIGWQLLSLLITAAIVLAGVERGIEKLSTLLMPVLALLLGALAVHSAMLPGFARGAAFLLQPDWSALAEPMLYAAALGQAFFSIGLAMGVMVTYGSYVPARHALPGAAFAVAIGDALFALVAGLVIFPALFSLGLTPAQGPALAFVVLPEIFASIDGGRWVAGAFFLLLAIAAVTSAVSLLEVLVSFMMNRAGCSRAGATLIATALVALAGMPASLGFGSWSHVSVGGLGILDAMDFLAADVLLPLNGLLIAVFAGWRWSRESAYSACDLQSARSRLFWTFSIRYLTPLVIAIVLAASLLRS